MENDKQNEIVYNPFTEDEMHYLIRQLQWKKEVCMFKERKQFFQSMISKLIKMQVRESKRGK